MSDKFFYSQFSNALIDIVEQYQQELYPDTPGVKDPRISTELTCKDWMNFYVPLYVKYIDIFKRVEDCYDQTIHPQMRKVIKSFLVNIMCRVVQIKKSLILYNNPIIEVNTGLSYIFLDDYLVEMKLEPKNLDLPIPRYFLEPSEEIVNRNILIDQRLVEKNGNALPEIDTNKCFFAVNLNMEEAVKTLQNFEMGRQNLKRISKALKMAQKKLENEMGIEKKILMEDERKKLVFEHLIALHKVRRTQEEEMKFLKMLPDNSPENNLCVKIAEETRNHRKIMQKEKQEEYDTYKKDLAKNIELVEGYEIYQDLVNQRKDWIEKEKQVNKGVAPVSIDEFYKRNEVEKREELDDQQKKVLEGQAKDKLKKEQDKKKKEESGTRIAMPVHDGPTKQAKRLTELTEKFKQNFETPSEFINKRETFIQDISRAEVIDDINETIRKQVDAIIDMEITNKRTIYLKGKKDRKPGKGRNRPHKVVTEKMGPGEKALAKMDVNELFSDIVMNGVARKMVPKDLDDLICDFNYISNSMQQVDEQLIDVPFFYTKQLIKEFCIYPLGCKLVKSNTNNIPSILFFGPPGTGKTHAAMAIAHHTNALFIDLSPKNMERFTSKEELTKMVASAFRAARFNQPAVIYFDNAEQIFVDTKKYKKGAVKNPSAQRLKKLLISYKNLVTADMRIMFIGCTNKGYHMNMKDMGNMFEKTLYFSVPSFSDRIKIWQREISKKVGRVYELEYDILAQITKNFSTESIIACVDYTLSKQRLEKVKFSPIKVDEFISALTKTQYLFKAEYEDNKTFLYEASGLSAIHKELQKKRDEMEKNTKKK